MFNSSIFDMGWATEATQAVTPQTLMAWAFAPSAKLVDLVSQDMKAYIHPHWNMFPPINPMWHTLLGVVYTFLGIISLIGKSFIITLFQFFFLYLSKKVKIWPHFGFLRSKFIQILGLKSIFCFLRSNLLHFGFSVLR